jgi:hypothetical protein
MPKEIEAEVRKSAAKKGLSGDKADQYVYGAMNNKGFMKGNKETPKGEAAEAKFNKDHGKSEPEGSAAEEASESKAEAKAEGDDPVTKRKKKQKARAKAVVQGADPDAAEGALGFGGPSMGGNQGNFGGGMGYGG